MSKEHVEGSLDGELLRGERHEGQEEFLLSRPHRILAEGKLE